MGIPSSRFLLNIALNLFLSFFFCKYEIELLPFKICLGNLDAKFITELVGMMTTATNETVVFLVELIVVIVKVFDAHHTFTVVLVDLAVDTVTGDT